MVDCISTVSEEPSNIGGGNPNSHPQVLAIDENGSEAALIVVANAIKLQLLHYPIAACRLARTTRTTSSPMVAFPNARQVGGLLAAENPARRWLVRWIFQASGTSTSHLSPNRDEYPCYLY